MAALKGEVEADGRTYTSRLGHHRLKVMASTWQTFVTTHLNKDGSGEVEVRQNGKVIHYHRIEAE
jgi:hypothetical protein